MAQIFKAKTLVSSTGRFSYEATAPNLVYNTGDQIISGNKFFVDNINVSGSGIFNALDLNNIDTLTISGVDISIINGEVGLTNRPTVNGTGVLLSGEAAKLNSANYVTVKVTDNAIVNGNNLLAAYDLAKTVTPNGAALSTSNRLAVILPPARYDLGTQSLILDTEYIDIIGSTSDRSKHYITSDVGEANRGTVQQTANDVKLYNLTIENSNTTYPAQEPNIDNPSAYFPDSNLNLTYIENVLFSSNSDFDLIWVFSMRSGIEYSGTFINCTAGDFSFGGYIGIASGIFKDCIGGNYSFVFYGTISGTFTNCSSGFGSFGLNSTTTGIFKDCTGGIVSFGGNAGSASGTFTNCSGGASSFGGYNGTATGTFKDCTGGDYSFGGKGDGPGLASGTFINCTGGLASFGGGGGTASGTFKDCTAGSRSFGGDGLPNYLGIIVRGRPSGTFTNCNGGIGSFGL